MSGIDMTSGPIIRKVIRIALPILVTNLINMVHNLVDMFWLGQVNQDALSAVGAMGVYIWLGISLAALIKVGTEVMISQEYGKSDLVRVNQFATNGLLLSIILAAIYGLTIAIFKDAFIGVYNFESINIVNMAYDYLKYLPAIVFFLIIVHQFMATYNGQGNTKLVFIFVSLGLVVNMVLDPLFIIVLGWGVGGAGLATMIAMFSMLVMFGVYSRYKSETFEHFRANIDFAKCKIILNLGIVPMIHQVIFTSVFIIMGVYIVKFGDENVAVSRIGGQVESLTWIVGAAATTAVTVFTGQNYGVKNFKRIARGTAFVMLSMVVYSFVVSMLFVMYGREIFLIFLPNEPTTATLGAMYLLINAPSQVFMMVEGVLTGFFNGQGHTKVPAFASIFGNVIRVPLMVLFGNMYGINGVWIAMCISASLKGIILIVQFIISVVKNDEYKFRYFNLKKEVRNA